MFGAEFILKATEKLPEIVPNREYLRAQLAPLQISGERCYRLARLKSRSRKQRGCKG